MQSLKLKLAEHMHNNERDHGGMTNSSRCKHENQAQAAETKANANVKARFTFKFKAEDEDKTKIDGKSHIIPKLLDHLDLPTLPVELWIEIFRHAVTPPFGLDGEAAPQNIQFHYRALIFHPHFNPALELARKTKMNLRLVCRLWKVAVDGIRGIGEINEIAEIAEIGTTLGDATYSSLIWIGSFDIDRAAQYGPCARLKTNLNTYSKLNHISPENKYHHEVNVVSLQIECLDSNPDQDDRSNPDLRCLLAKPWSLSALHITIISSPHHPISSFPIRVVQELPSLRTLSIWSGSWRPVMFNGSLKLPSLTTFFLTICYDPTSFTANTVELDDWDFPSLHTLSIETRSWRPRLGNFTDASDTFESPSRGHQDQEFEISQTDQFALTTFLRSHKRKLKSLRVIPFSLLDLERDVSPLEFPNLEALATDFVRFNPFNYLIDQGRKGKQLALPNIRHLIQTNTQPCDQETFSTVLLALVEILFTVKSLTITEEPSIEKSSRHKPDSDGVDHLHRYAESKQGAKELQRLDEFCEKYGVEIIGDMGLRSCCIQKLWKDISL